MGDNGNKSIYPSSVIQQEALLATKEPPQPPTYQEATDGNTPNVASSRTAGPTVVVVTELALAYGPHPIDVQCPYCHNFCRTRLRHKPNSRTHLMALLLCLFQLYCCICLPYCIGSCMNINHYCGICDRYLGTFKR